MRMKRMILAAAMVFAFSLAANAMNANALGVRLSRGAELNYQRAMPGNTRFEIGASWAFNSDYFGVRADYHVLHRNIQNGFNWYLGPDVYVAFRSDPEIHGRFQIGLEHDFNVFAVPLLVSLDMAAGLEIIPDTRGSWDVGLGIRWTF